jgi:four helix bundle protein
VEKPHRRLEVWKKSMDLVTFVYSKTASHPAEERFGLVGQMRRCAVSIPSNLAEGSARRNDKELIQFLHVAMGSASELDTQLEISRRLGYLSEPDGVQADELLTEVDKMLVGLRNHLLRKRAKT